MAAASEALPNPPARQWPAVAAVAAVLSFVVLGGYGVGALLSQPEGPPVVVGGIVTIEPLSGWRVAGRSADGSSVLLVRGGASLSVRAVRFGGPPIELLRSYVSGVLEAGADRLSVSSRVDDARVAGGLAGVRLAYVGRLRRVAVQVEGEVSAATTPSGAGVVFDASAPVGLLQYVLGDIRVMIERAQVHR